MSNGSTRVTEPVAIHLTIRTKLTRQHTGFHAVHMQEQTDFLRDGATEHSDLCAA